MQAMGVCYPSAWRGLVVLQGTYRTIIVSAVSVMHDFIPVQPKPMSSILLLAELSLDRGSSISGTFEPHPNLVRFFLTFCLTCLYFLCFPFFTYRSFSVLSNQLFDHPFKQFPFLIFYSFTCKNLNLMSCKHSV